MAKELSSDPLVRLAHTNGGSMEVRPRKHGTAYVYRYRYKGRNCHKSFRAGTPLRVIRAFMRNEQQKVQSQKRGIPIVRKPVRIQLRFSEIWQWYEHNVLTKAGRETQYMLRYAAKKFEVFLRVRGLHKRSVEKLSESELLEFQSWISETERLAEASAIVLLIRLRKIFQTAVKNGLVENFPFPK